MLRFAPLLVVQGARQVGKTTLLRQVFDGNEAVFTSLGDAATREAALTDPRGFVEQAPQKTLVIDEAQRVPELALAFKSAIDTLADLDGRQLQDLLTYCGHQACLILWWGEQSR
ncbi:hypothetical protein CCYS_13400 [Corynebacterium cystitidis DSM 20524]|uniref:AAA domain-containing protein n=1 Tax=Corynebacterium cystitidis DSM 20524 TaxID=1121357 RepID=A0A1H9TD49_9CORY|nr:hypothetical protein CCYS_13400 [Corynebacterium cystitidis DSM 20524]SER95036.1 AAA domain-containing protein [Corynebacterium cystitidis DSM 20524]SNV92037.1 Uncharacterised protein [Corynebacterium cystitidis]